MRFIIDGAEYEAANLERVTGLDALDLPKQAGIGLQTLARRLEELPRLGYGEDGSVVALPEGAAGVDGNAALDSEPHLRALLAFLWLSRRLAGDRRLTFEAASSFPITSLQIVEDEPEPDPESEADPQSPSPAGAPGDGAADAA